MATTPTRRRLTDLWVQQTKTPDTTWDTLLPGFGLRVGARTKTWIVAVRRGGSPHPIRLKIGRWPQMPLAAARERARLELGQAENKPITLRQVVVEFLAHGLTKKGRPLRENSLGQYRRNLDGYAAKLLARPIAEIGRRDVAPLLREIAENSGVPTAKLVRAMLGRVWSFSIEQGHVEYNVVAGTSNYEIEPRTRVLDDHEIKKLWEATAGVDDFHMIARACLWTGCRRSEAGGMCWSELANGVWTVPGDRTKNRNALVLPLPQQMIAALAAWPRSGSDHLFGRGSAHGFTRWSAAKARLDSQLKFAEPWGLHSLRRTAETRLAKLGVAKEVRDRILNHDIGAIARAYDQHDYTAEKAAALQKLADAIEQIVL